MLGRTIAVAACLAALAWSAAPAAAATDGQIDTAVDGAVAWLRAQQAPDGSLGPNHGLDPAWALLGLAGAGVHAADVRVASGDASAQDYYATLWAGSDDGAWAALGGAPSAADYERAILLAGVAGVDPRRLSAQQNLLAKLAGSYVDGWFTSTRSVFNHTLFGLLALERLPVGAGLVERTARIVEANQHDDGGYTSVPATDAATRATPGNVDATGAALAGLCGAGRTLADPSVAGAVAFLRAGGPGAGGVDGASWALDGLAACGLRRGAAGWLPGDEAAVDWLLGAQLTSGPGAGAWAPNGGADAYATQNALRALADPGFAAPPPPRANPGDPLLRAVPIVADGTPVPVALAIDPGLGDARLCSTTAPSGASLTAVLAAAQAASSPPGCVHDVAVDGGVVTAIDGAVAAPGGGWRVSLDGAPEQAAGTQAVGFGDVVALRLQDPLPLAFDPAALDFGTQPVGLLGAPRAVTLANGGADDFSVTRLRIAGTDAADFVVSSQACVGETLAPGAGCEARVRFAPGASGARTATLVAEHDGPGAAPGLVLLGDGGAATAGPPGPAGAPGAVGAAGAAGTSTAAGPLGAAGATGLAGRRGARGRVGRPARISCRIAGRVARRLVCVLSFGRRAARKRVALRLAVPSPRSPRRTR